MKVLVTGGAGFIGSHTVVALLQKNHEVVVVDDFRNAKEFIIDRIEEITCKTVKLYKEDCCDKRAMEKVFNAESPDAIIHFAAYKAVGESVEHPEMYFENNVGSMKTMLEMCERFNTKYFVFSSSCTVYGQPDRIPVDETAPDNRAESPYGETKQICEKLLLEYSEKGQVKGVSLRYFNPIGAHESARIGELPLGAPNNLVPIITRSVRKGTAIKVNGDDYDTKDGSNVRDYIHVMDLADAHVAAIDYMASTEKSHDVFNVGTGLGVSVLELIHVFEKETGEKINYNIGPRRPGDVVQIYAETDKANKLLKWEAKRSLKDALVSSWNWEKTLTD